MSVVSVYMLAYWAWAHYSIKLALHSYCSYYKKDTSIKILTFFTQNNVQTNLHKIIAHFYRLSYNSCLLICGFVILKIFN